MEVRKENQLEHLVVKTTMPEMKNILDGIN